jgi:hypothetical protein
MGPLDRTPAVGAAVTKVELERKAQMDEQTEDEHR